MKTPWLSPRSGSIFSWHAEFFPFLLVCTCSLSFHYQFSSFLRWLGFDWQCRDPCPELFNAAEQCRASKEELLIAHAPCGPSCWLWAFGFWICFWMKDSSTKNIFVFLPQFLVWKYISLFDIHCTWNLYLLVK